MYDIICRRPRKEYSWVWNPFDQENALVSPYNSLANLVHFYSIRSPPKSPDIFQGGKAIIMHRGPKDIVVSLVGVREAAI